MLSIIINYFRNLIYGVPYQPYTPIIDNTFVIIPKQPAKSTLSSEASADGFSLRVEHLNQIKNFEFKKNRHYYFKY
jgi:hypothetical protein